MTHFLWLMALLVACVLVYRHGLHDGWGNGMAHAAALRAERERLAEEQAQRDAADALARRERIKTENRRQGQLRRYGKGAT